MHFDEKSMFSGDKKGAKSLKVKRPQSKDRVGTLYTGCFPAFIHLDSSPVSQLFDVDLIEFDHKWVPLKNPSYFLTSSHF